MGNATCRSCGKTLEVYHADEGTCSYVPCGCQLERDLEVARRVPATLLPDSWVGCTYDPDQDNDEFSIEDSAQTVWTNWYDSTEPTSPESAERLRLLLDAACAAPRLAAEVERLREEVSGYEKCEANTVHVSLMIERDMIDAVRKCGEDDKHLTITAYSCIRVADALDELERLREEVATLRQFIGITNDALPTDEALWLEREKYSTLEKISARIRGQFKTYEDVCNENANLRERVSDLEETLARTRQELSEANAVCFGDEGEK